MPKGMNKLFNVFGFLSAFTGFYFLSWSLNPYVEKDFHPALYYGAMVFISAVLAYSIRFYRSTVKRLSMKLDSVLGFFVEIRNVHYRRLLKTAMKNDLYDQAYQEELKKGTKDFEKRIYDKADEIME